MQVSPHRLKFTIYSGGTGGQLSHVLTGDPLFSGALVYACIRWRCGGLI